MTVVGIFRNTEGDIRMISGISNTGQEMYFCDFAYVICTDNTFIVYKSKSMPGLKCKDPFSLLKEASDFYNRMDNINEIFDRNPTN